MYLFLYDLWCWLEKKRYRLLCMLLSERELGDRKVGERKVGERKVSDWLSIFV